MGQILDSHPQIAASIERRRFFKLASGMALDARRNDTDAPRLIRLYRYEIARVAPRHLADKSHTNIWIADRLANAFPEAVFVGVRRDAYGTVASMLRHRGVQRWSENWRDYPLPNRFLGIEAGEGEWYESLGAAARSTLRWISHEARFEELRPVLGERLIEVRYDELQLDTDATLSLVQARIGLAEPFPPQHPQRSSLDRWREELTTEQIVEIDRMLAHRGWAAHA
jgi:hypothetical protein